jgi:hypothetical protein
MVRSETAHYGDPDDKGQEGRMMRNAWTVMLIVIGFSSLSGYGATDSPSQSAERALSQGITFQGDVALWTVAIKPDRTADFEKVLMRLRDALQKSDNPQRKQQAVGWRVMKMEKPLPDGNIAYVHLIRPVVAGADYTILKTLYDEFPSEGQQLYELYRGAFAQNLAAASGSVVLDMSKPQ